jgi:hypothetical protein
MFQWRERKAFVIAGALILVCIGLVSLTFRPSLSPADTAAVPDSLPTEFSDAEFWKIIGDFSEPNGYFRSDNLLSNESGLQDVIPSLREHTTPGGVYVGVGPEQNFTYILALEPKLSFIVDIRRLNLLEHLLYKAIFELAEERADFVSILFSRPRPKGLTANTGVEELFTRYDDVLADGAAFERNLHTILGHLTDTRGFALSDEDLFQIRYVLSSFYQEGPDLSYSFLGSSYQGTLGMPTYRQLMRKNLIIPLVGDFAGPKTIRAIGRYMREHRALLSVFYTSNVEMYLFQQGDDWKRFYSNVSTLPANSHSSFIRFAAGRRRRGGPGTGYFSMRSQMWSPVQDVIASVRASRIDDYSGVLEMSQ